MSLGVDSSAAPKIGRCGRLLLVLLVAITSIGWNHKTVRHVSWSAVDFLPPDLERQVRRHHRRFDAGIERGLGASPSWRAGPPGNLERALTSQVEHCSQALRTPVPLQDLVEELGVLAVRVLDANDPLAVSHGDPREPRYASQYAHYVDTVLGRVRLVYYGLDGELIYGPGVAPTVRRTFDRSAGLYPYVGDEFFRTGSLRDWHHFDDRSVAFGVAAVSLSRALTDLANLAAYIWHQGGGKVPEPQPTPEGHVGPTLTVSLDGGFPERERPSHGKPVMPQSGLVLPPP